MQTAMVYVPTPSTTRLVVAYALCSAVSRATNIYPDCSTEQLLRLVQPVCPKTPVVRG